MGGFYTGMPGQTLPPDPIEEGRRVREDTARYYREQAAKAPPGSAIQASLEARAREEESGYLTPPPAPGQPIGGVPAAVQRPIPPAGPSGEVIVPQGPEQRQMFGRPASEEEAFYRESVGAGPVGAATTRTQMNVPPGDFAKFVEARRGKTAEIPGAGIINRELPTDPRALYELNQFLTGFEADKLRGDVERAQGLQALEEAQINPRDIAAAKVGLLKGQTEESLGQAEAAKGTGELMRAKASTEAPSPAQGKARGEATAAEIIAQEQATSQGAIAYISTPQGMAQVEMAAAALAQKYPQASPAQITAAAQGQVMDAYKARARQEWLAPKIASRDPYAMMYGATGQ